MLSIFNSLGRKAVSLPDDYTLTLFGPEFSGKTLLFNTLVKPKESIPWINRTSGTARYQSRIFRIHDIPGDGLSHRLDGTDQLAGCINPSNGACVFVHDAAHGGLQESLNLLDIFVKESIKLGARFLFIVLNKQDVMLPVEDRWSTLHKLTSHFESHMSRYESSICWQVVRLDGFNGGSDTFANLLLDEIILTFRQFGSFRPMGKKVSPKPRNPTLPIVVESEEPGFHSKLDSKTFWERLKNESLVLNTHADRLRATYLTVLNAIQTGQSMLELAEEMQTLEESRASYDTAFKHHRTMVLFWLFIFRDIILNIRRETGTLPSSEESLDVVKRCLPLLKPDIWKGYYSESLMLDPKTAMYWRSPDLYEISASSITRRLIPLLPKPQSRVSRVENFAFAVVKLYLGCSAPSKRWIVEQALAVLESFTMRLRSKHAIVEPFSETQLYFWISRISALLSSFPYFGSTSTSTTFLRQPCVLDITFDDFVTAGLLSPLAWKEHYSPRVWHSIEARMRTIEPDLRPLKSCFSFPQQPLDLARINENSMRPELPSEEELMLHLIVAEKQLCSANFGNLTSLVHGQHLFLIFVQLITHPNIENFEDCLENITPVMKSKSELLSSLPFWTRHIWDRLRLDSGKGIIRIAKEGDLLNAFVKFLTIHLELLHERLWAGPHSIVERIERKQSEKRKNDTVPSTPENTVRKLAESTAAIDKESARRAAEAYISKALKMIEQAVPPTSTISVLGDDSESVSSEDSKDWELL